MPSDMMLAAEMSLPFVEVFERIKKRYPTVASIAHVGGLSMAVMPRALVNPRWHFVIEDEAFRREVSLIITMEHLPKTNHQGHDAVLVVCPAM